MRRVHKIPEIRFEDQGLTSFARVVIIQALFSSLKPISRLRFCFAHLPATLPLGIM